MASSTFLLIYLILEIIVHSFHFSVLILMTVKRKSNFKGPFFNIFRLVLLVDFLCFLSMVLFQKGAVIPFVMDYLINAPYFASIILAAINVSTTTQFLGHLFLALNRFTLIWFPLKHESIWRRQWYTVAILGLAFLNVSWKLPQSAAFLFDENSIVNLVYLDKSVVSLNSVISTIVLLSTTCFAAALNFLAFVKFLTVKKVNNVNERNLLFVSFISFIAQLMRVSYNGARIIYPPNHEIIAFYNTILPVLNDLFAWSGSISLMILSSSTRKVYKYFYLCKTNFTINSTGTVVTIKPKMFPTTIQ